MPQTLPLPAGPRSSVTRRRSPLCGHTRHPRMPRSGRYRLLPCHPSCAPLVGARAPPPRAPPRVTRLPPMPPPPRPCRPPLKGCCHSPPVGSPHPRTCFSSCSDTAHTAPPSPPSLAIGPPLRPPPPRWSCPSLERRRSPPPHRRPTSSVSPAFNPIARRSHLLAVVLELSTLPRPIHR
jgi:hypothetical protein